MKGISVAALLAASLTFLSGVQAAEAGGVCGHDNSECPSGFICAAVTDETSECVKWDGEEEVSSLKKRQGDTRTRIVGPQFGTNERWPVDRLQSQLPTVFNMFILGLNAMMTEPAETNVLSYYEIAGIHGAPYKAWNGEPNSGRALGYCTHASALFATWHRPYLSLLEQRISAHAINIASKFRGSAAATWQRDATRVRLPFWDWSSNGSQMPGALRAATITVTRPNRSTGQPERVTITNPLYAYRFRSTAALRAMSNRSPYRDVPATRRCPPRDLSSNNMGAANANMVNSFSQRREQTCNVLMTSQTTFNSMSNNAFDAGQRPSQFVSLEGIHDAVHVNMGCSYGHMTFVEYSAFDPVFWLHHCNVDRLMAMWQAIWPQKATLTPQRSRPTFGNPSSSQDTIDTRLTPFHKGNGNYYTSRDVIRADSIWNLRYAYPEVPARFRGQSTSSLAAFTRSQANSKYCQAGGSRKRDVDTSDTIAPLPTKYREWMLHVQWNNQDLTGKATEFLMFIGNQTEQDPMKLQEDPNYVGYAAAFTRQDDIMNVTIGNSIPLTNTLKKTIDTLDTLKVVAYLKLGLNWRIRCDGELVDLAQVPSLKIGVSSAPTNISPDGIKEYGDWETHYEITETKEAGYVPADDSQIGSTVAKDVVANIPIDKLPAKVDQLLGGKVDIPIVSGILDASKGEPTGSST
jgi:tyrosinase